MKTVKKKKRKFVFLIVISSLLLSGCGKAEDRTDIFDFSQEYEESKDVETIDFTTGEVLEVGQKHWTTKQHKSFLNKKLREWSYLKEEINNTYTIDIYMEAIDFIGHDEGRALVERGVVREYDSFESSENQNRRLGSIVTIDTIFKKIFIYFGIKDEPENREHCDVYYEFVERWPFPRSIELSCDDFVPDVDRKLIIVQDFWY